MSSDPWAGPIILQLVLLILHFCFAMAEAALQNINEPKLRKAAEDGDQTAFRLCRIAEQTDDIVQSVQLLLTLIECLAAGIAAYTFAPRVAAGLSGLMGNGAMIPGVLTVIAVITVIYQLFGAILPRRLARLCADRIAQKMLGCLRTVYAVMRPFAALYNLLAGLLLRLFGVDPNAVPEEVTEEEIMLMVDMGEETGAIETAEKEMIENIFEFNNLSAEDVMTHRTDVTSIWVGDDRDTVLHTIRESGLSRFPVYDEDIDDIIGTLNARDYLMDCQNPRPRPLRSLLREAYFVPETVQADDLFHDLQKRKVHMAIVVDEYGGMSGIVTMEDLLEEIVGNIYDEFDPQQEAEITQIDEQTWQISGAAPLEDVAKALEIDLPLEDGYDTLGGLIFDQFTTIPDDGTTPCVDVAGLHIQVEQISEHRVERALVTKLPEMEQLDADDDPDDP